MSGLLRRLTRRGPATADENRSPATESSEPVAVPAETPADAGGQQPVAAEQPTVALPVTAEHPAAHTPPLPAWTVAASQPTTFAAQPAPARDLPAGVDPHDLASAPAASARRGKLRRRLRYLRQVRELLLRDLGGFTYEIHRTAGGTAEDPQRRLSAAKAERLSALDAEVLALESRLGEPHSGTLLREPGIGGTCPECGELHASDAHFCSRCGTPLDDKARAQRAAERPTTGSQEAVAEPQPASVLWAGGQHPTAQPEAREDEAAAESPSAVTSQWLATDPPTTSSRAAQAEAKPDEPAGEVKAAEPRPEEPVAGRDEPAAADEPMAGRDEPAAADEPMAGRDEPAAADEAAKQDEAPATPDDEPPPGPATAAARAKPNRAAEPAPAKKPEASGNGRRDEDVPPPLTGDPLASQREERP
jgi:hypothetical protein